MKRNALLLLTLSLLALLAAGCGAKPSAENVIKVGATAVPHAEVLEAIKDELAERGYELDITVFNDYVLPNKALSEGQLDANYFQHVPYLEKMNETDNLGLVYTVKVHVEPMGLYSKRIASLEELADGATVAIPNDATNGARALLLLEAHGLIRLNDKDLVSVLDIVENPRNLRFQELDAPALPRTLEDVDASVINTNYALEAGLNPTADAIIIEGADSPYANILAVRQGDETAEKIRVLGEVLNSDVVRRFIETKYQGAIVPAF